MKKNTFFLALLSIILVYSCSQSKEEQAVRPPEIPMEDFFKNPETFRYRLSPDGKSISYLDAYKSRMNIHVKDLASGNVVRVTEDTARDVRLYYWANNDQLLYLQDTGGDENWQLFSVDKTGQGVKALTDFEGVRTNIIDDLPDNEQEVIVGLNKNNPRVFDPYRLNIVTGEMEQIAQNPGDITGWMTDHNGKLRVAVRTDGVNQVLLYRETEDDEFEEVISTNFKETLSPVLFTFDNQNLYVLTNLDRNTDAVAIFDLETGEVTEILYENPDYDVTGLNYSRKRKVLTYATYEGAKVDRYFFDEQTRAMFDDIEASIDSSKEIQVLASTKEEDRYMYVTYSDRSGTVYHTYHANTGDTKLIADTAPWINEEHMASMKPIQYTARDGMTINGYLTVPVGVDPKNLPMVVNPHGGPWARDSWGYNPEVQFLANRGYAVLQINFRGSTGFGREFWESSFKQWGQAMQDDVTDGVQYVIDQGIADPDRIAIYGGSYGGYTTLAGVAFTPDLYAAGIDYVGVSNLFTFMGTIPPYWEPYLNMMYEMVGDPNDPEDSVMMYNASPVFHADKIKVPMLIAQGAKDPRVNIDESDQIVEALEKNMLDVKYIVKENEGHGFSNEENRFEFYGEMETFLDKHIGDGKVPEKSDM